MKVLISGTVLIAGEKLEAWNCEGKKENVGIIKKTNTYMSLKQHKLVCFKAVCQDDEQEYYLLVAKSKVFLTHEKTRRGKNIKGILLNFAEDKAEECTAEIGKVKEIISVNGVRFITSDTLPHVLVLEMLDTDES